MSTYQLEISGDTIAVDVTETAFTAIELNIGPQGPIGPAGPVGPQGPQGANGSGAVSSVQGLIGDVVLTPEILGDILGGGPNFFTGLDSNGDLNVIPSWQLGDLGGGNVTISVLPDDDSGGFNIHNLNVAFSPLQDSDDVTYNAYNTYVQFDVNNGGFSQGMNTNAMTMFSNTMRNIGKGDIGAMNFVSSYFELGNGTDPITSKGAGYAFGFGSVKNNVTLDGPIQGYGFQPVIEAGVITTGASYFAPFYDNANIACAAGPYTSFNASPIIASIKTNTGYVGYSLSPNISVFSGNSGFNGIAISPQLGTLGTGYVSMINVNPTVTSGTNVDGIYVNMSNVTGTNVKALNVVGDVAIDGALTFTGGLSIGQLQAFYATNPVDGGGNPQNLHGLTTQMIALNGVTTANADAIGVNTAMLITLEANSTTTSGPFGLGFAALALPCVVETHTGSTIDFMNAAVYAINLSGASTGGTIDNLNLCRTVAIPNGITTINKLKAYAFDLPFGDPGTATWGIYMEPNVNNWMKKNLKIGGSVGVSDTTTHAFHVQGSSYFDGLIGFFATSPVVQQASSGPATAGGTYNATVQVMIQEMYDALRAYGLLT